MSALIIKSKETSVRRVIQRRMQRRGRCLGGGKRKSGKRERSLGARYSPPMAHETSSARSPLITHSGGEPSPYTSKDRVGWRSVTVISVRFGNYSSRPSTPSLPSCRARGVPVVSVAPSHQIGEITRLHLLPRTPTSDRPRNLVATSCIGFLYAGKQIFRKGSDRS
jgi:hypothetical protein